MIIYFERTDSYSDAARQLNITHAIFYRTDVDEKRMNINAFARINCKRPCEILVVEPGGLEVTTYFLGEKGVMEKYERLFVTKFGDVPKVNKNGIIVYGDYPSLRTHKQEVYDYFAKYVTRESREILLSTTSIPLMKSFSWFGVGVNPKISAGFNKFVLPTGKTVDADFLLNEKWVETLGFEKTKIQTNSGEPKSRSDDKKITLIDTIRFNAYSYRFVAKERERMDQNDFSPTKLKKVEFKVRPGVIEKYNEELAEGKITRAKRAASVKGPQCNNCPIRAECPAFQEDSVCAFIDDFQKISAVFNSRDRDVLLRGLQLVLSSESERYTRSKIMDSIGNKASMETRQIAESIFKNTKILLDIAEPEAANKGHRGQTVIINQGTMQVNGVRDELEKLPDDQRENFIEFVRGMVGAKEIKDEINDIALSDA